MNKPWHWMTLIAGLIIVAVAALLFANSSFASGIFSTPPVSLDQTHWNLVSINGQAPIAGRTLTLNFQSASQLVGDSGCNSYGAQYQVNGSSIKIDQLISTMRACVEQPLNTQEALFQNALSHAASITVSGGQLTLKDSGGSAVLVFQQA